MAPVLRAMACDQSMIRMTVAGRAAVTVRNADADVLHHALVLVIEDVAMQHELADVALVAGAHIHLITLAVIRRCCIAYRALDEQSVLPDPLEAGVLLVILIGRVYGTRQRQVTAIGADDLLDLKRIDVDMERVTGQSRLQLPGFRSAERQLTIDHIGRVRPGIADCRSYSKLEVALGVPGNLERQVLLQIAAGLEFLVGDVLMRHEARQLQVVLEVGNDLVLHIR